MLAAFHFQQPLWLLLLPVFAVLGYLWQHQKGRTQEYWSQVCDPALLPLLLKEGQTASTKRAPLLAIAVAAVLLAVAAAQPVWKQQPVPAFKQSAAVVIALDLSASMNATDIKPSRLQRAHFKIEDLLGRLPDSQVALVVYAGDAFVVTPLTEDTSTILAQLPVMQPEIMPSPGSRADRALKQANEVLTQAGVRGGSVLLISDEVEPAQIAAEASRLAQQGRTLSILAVGSAQGAPIPTQFGPLKDRQGQVILARTNMSEMREAAALGGGKAVQLVADDSDLTTLIATFASGKREEVKAATEVERWIAEGPWFVLLALPLLLPLFRRGMLNQVLPLMLPVICLGAVSFTPDAQAGIWQDLWKTADQQAAEKYQAGDKAAAADTFADPRWKQVAAYEAQNYDAALQSVATPETAADWYNRGNILAQQQKIDEAIAAFEQALKQQPDHENAKVNKKLLEDLKKQQEQQQKQDQQQQDQQQGGEPQQSSSDKQDKQDQQGQQSEPTDQTQSGEQASNNEKNASAETPPQTDPAKKDLQGETANQTAEQAADSTKEKDKGQKQAADYLKQQMDQARSHDGEETASVAAEQPDQPIDESEQARQQLLNRIVDDPAGLWRRKFLYQYRQQAEQNSGEEKTW
ncbi:VWA domain-containing protein [Neptunomonas qingdaonensis]|uniref:Ca-activated chloride channel family protein n=1 Tax=Neptunomonas qingdaonensis TaxID=1045558 RepID=A0A1I2VFV4_9GAMM|nr:VWA domain-containing protein [Neptunomonas qingdaonensis]SFG86326.1 Ca-activated chloride channel family protein [Neptunomonas qingdaonensis]